MVPIYITDAYIKLQILSLLFETMIFSGRLTLTNQALYFEASKAISYETALKIDLSNAGVDHQVKAASTGPWGAPLFDKAIAYESSQL